MRTHVFGAILLITAAAGCDNEPDRNDEIVEREVGDTSAEVRGEAQELEGQGDQERDEYVRATRARIDTLDQRIEQLEARTDEEARQTARDLRQRRDQLAAQLDQAGDRAGAEWEQFKAEVDRGVNELEQDLREAF